MARCSRRTSSRRDASVRPDRSRNSRIAKRGCSLIAAKVKAKKAVAAGIGNGRVKTHVFLHGGLARGHRLFPAQQAGVHCGHGAGIAAARGLGGDFSFQAAAEFQKIVHIGNVVKRAERDHRLRLRLVADVVARALARQHPGHLHTGIGPEDRQRRDRCGQHAIQPPGLRGLKNRPWHADLRAPVTRRYSGP